MAEAIGEHTARRAKEFNSSTLLVKLSPEAQQSLNGVMTAIMKHGHFDADEYDAMGRLARGEMSALSLVLLMKHATQQLHKHTEETGNGEAESAWNNFTAMLLEGSTYGSALTFVAPRKGRQPGGG